MERSLLPCVAVPPPLDAALVREAEAAVQLTAGQPQRAAEDAREIQRRATAEHLLEAASVAERALGLAAKELGDLATAQTHLESAIDLARRGELEVREGEARTSLAVVLALNGRTQQALEEADVAATLLEGRDADAARLDVQRAAILQRLGRHDEAMDSYRLAGTVFSQRGQALETAQVHTNRGILRAYRGDLSAAEADLRAAHRIYVDLGLEVKAAEARHNLGFVAAKRGDVPSALACYDAAAEVFRRLHVARPAALLDRCESLLAVRLVAEGRRLAERAVSELERAGMNYDLAEARLVLAQATMLDGDAPRALQAAELAWRSFVQQDRPGWAALGRYAVLTAASQAEGPGTPSLHEAVRTADELEAAGWAVPAADARLIAARAALGRGLVDEAEAQLVATTASRRSGPAELRARAWHAEALLRLARGDERSALAALRAGLLVLDQHQATFGATELRVHAKSHASELATLGLRIAVGHQRPEPVLTWAERWRAGLHRMPRARLPEDPTVAAKLTELRQVVTDFEAAAVAGKGTAGLLRRQAALEAEIKRLSRHLPGSRAVGLSRPATAASLAEALGDRALVEMVESDGIFYAVTLVEGRARLRGLASAEEVAREVAQLRFSLGRLVAGHRTSSWEACEAALQHASRRLDALLLLSVVADVDERGIVIVPTGVLHRLPWAVLPSCRRRSVTVAPSATQWLLAAKKVEPAPRGHSLLVAGPGCGSAIDEVAELAPLVARAACLVGEEATVARVGSGFSGARMAHIVAHGTFRSDNPLFSSLQLADGPLTVCDLELLQHVPPLMVLSACDGGASAVAAGDELLGLTSALLSFDARNVVASVTSVPDDLTRRLMVEFHRRLASGAETAAALTAARRELEADVGAGDPRVHAVTGFTCYGAG